MDNKDGLAWLLTAAITAGAMSLALLLGFEISWKLMVLIFGTGFMTETACSIYWARRPRRS